MIGLVEGFVELIGAIVLVVTLVLFFGTIFGVVTWL